MTSALSNPVTCLLADLDRGASAVVVQVLPRTGAAVDPVALRLEDLGFVSGEPVRVISHGPFGGDPIVVQIGYTRFALRRREAARIVVAVEQPS